MSTGTLYVSFWHICLDNLPEGAFRHRRIASDEAREAVAQARQEDKLRCVTHDDLGAPYKKREADNHAALCRVLHEDFGITLSTDDFFSRHDDEDGEALYFANGLSLVQVHGDRRLLVVTCNYVFPAERTATELPVFDIAADTVEFHLIGQ